MSIKPVDFNVMLPKTQEISISKHIENVKNQNIIDSQFVAKDKILQRDKKRVMNTEKTEHSKINTKKKFKDQSSKDSESRQDNKDELEKDKDNSNNKIGCKIDIRI